MSGGSKRNVTDICVSDLFSVDFISGGGVLAAHQVVVNSRDPRAWYTTGREAPEARDSDEKREREPGEWRKGIATLLNTLLLMWNGIM